jgi:endonuclease YncB( thermonuclease family)
MMLPPGGQFARIAYVVDGDIVDLTNGARIRLVQIDTPEVYNSPTLVIAIERGHERRRDTDTTRTTTKEAGIVAAM